MINDVVIYAHFDNDGQNDPESLFYNVDKDNLTSLNNVSENLSLRIEDNNEADKLTFSSNGIDGLGDDIKSFNINNINYVGQKIYFVVKYKSSDNFDVKSIPLLSLNSSSQYGVSLSCFQGSTPVDVEFFSNNDVSNSGGGFLKGYMVFDKPLTNLILKGSSNTGTKSITGESNIFNIYPKSGLNDYRKINENNDQQKNYKDLIFQNILLDKDNFFNNFLGTIVGNLSSSTDTLGIKIYEKISNFVENNSDINYSNINSLLSQFESLDLDFEKYDIIFPPSLQRLVDLLSVNLSLQKGAKNNYNLNFDDKGYVNSNIYGVNKGPEIKVFNGVLSANQNFIVAYEKFGQKYSLLNTNLLSSYDLRLKDINTFTYNLSDYSDKWGWGLILPDKLIERNFLKLENRETDIFLSLQDGYYRIVNEKYDPINNNPLLLQDYYNFYFYIDKIDGTYIQKFIDFDNPNNKLFNLNNYEKYAEDNGTIDELFSHNIYTNTGLVTSTVK